MQQAPQQRRTSSKQHHAGGAHRWVLLRRRKERTRAHIHAGREWDEQLRDWGQRADLVCKSRMLDDARMKKVPPPKTRLVCEAFFQSTSELKLAAPSTGQQSRLSISRARQSTSTSTAGTQTLSHDALTRLTNQCHTRGSANEPKGTSGSCMGSQLGLHLKQAFSPETYPMTILQMLPRRVRHPVQVTPAPVQ